MKYYRRIDNLSLPLCIFNVLICLICFKIPLSLLVRDQCTLSHLTNTVLPLVPSKIRFAVFPLIIMTSAYIEGPSEE